MGMHWDSTVIIGFVLDRDDLEMPFKQTVKEQFHMEDRFDQRTGKKLAKQVKVVDKEECEEFFFKGESLGDDSSDLVSAIEDDLDCRISLHGNYCDGEDMVYAIEPSGANDDMTLKEIGDLQAECDRLRSLFKERYGIELGDARVCSLMSYS